MQEQYLFLPKGKPLNAIYFWLIPTAIVGLNFFVTGFSVENILVGTGVFFIFSIEIFQYRKTNSITISIGDKYLLYDYNNCWGQKCVKRIEIASATISFRYSLLNLTYRIYSKLKLGWRIKLYEGNYFRNRISIKQDDELGYNKDQLTEMYALIQECKKAT